MQNVAHKQLSVNPVTYSWQEASLHTNRSIDLGRTYRVFSTRTKPTPNLCRRGCKSYNFFRPLQALLERLRWRTKAQRKYVQTRPLPHLFTYTHTFPESVHFSANQNKSPTGDFCSFTSDVGSITHARRFGPLERVAGKCFASENARRAWVEVFAFFPCQNARG